MRLFYHLGVLLASLCALASPISGASLQTKVLVFPPDQRVDSSTKTNTFTAVLQSKINADFFSFVAQSTDGSPIKTPVLDGLLLEIRPPSQFGDLLKDFKTAASLNHSAAIIWNRAFTNDKQVSFFYMTTEPGTGGLAVNPIELVTVASPTSVETAGFAISQHEYLLAYLACREAYKAGSFKESLAYLTWGEETLPKPVPNSLKEIEREMGVIRQSLIAKVPHAH